MAHSLVANLTCLSQHPNGATDATGDAKMAAKPASGFFPELEHVASRSIWEERQGLPDVPPFRKPCSLATSCDYAYIPGAWR
jgi:hypothetical protein